MRDAKYNYWVSYAERIVKDTYGDSVSVWDKAKLLNKFGTTDNADTDTLTTVMNLPSSQAHETLLSSNGITHLVSSSVSDTETITVEGHTISGTDLTFSTQTLTLNGRTGVALTTPIATCTRISNNQPGASDLVGNIYAYEGNGTTAGVPDDDDEVHAMITAGEQQTAKCATAISSSDYWFLTKVSASISRNKTANADVQVQIRSTASNVWLPIGEVVTIRSASATSNKVDYQPFLIVPKNHHVRLVATATANDTTIHGEVHGVLAGMV